MGKKIPNHLDGKTVWHMVFCDIFDERRAAPPAYGRRAWSKVVSYLMVFRYVFRFRSEFTRCLNNTTVPNNHELRFCLLCDGSVTLLLYFNSLKSSSLIVVRKKFFGQIVSDGPKAHLKQSKLHLEHFWE